VAWGQSLADRLASLIIRPVLRHGSARRRSSGRATEQLHEEVHPATEAAPPAAPVIVRHCQELSTHRAVLALDRNISNFAFGPIQYDKQRLVAAVDILAEFKLALIIDESGLVGQVDRDEGRKLDVGLVGAKHPADAVLSIAFAWPHH